MAWPATDAEFSSSQAGLADFEKIGHPGSFALGAASAGGGQYGQGGGGGHHGFFHHPLAFEAGGGFNAPLGNDTPFITWGGNFTVGAGFHFSRVFSTLLEYLLDDDRSRPGEFFFAKKLATGRIPCWFG